MAGLDADATGTVPRALLPEQITHVIRHFRSRSTRRGCAPLSNDPAANQAFSDMPGAARACARFQSTRAHLGTIDAIAPRFNAYQNASLHCPAPRDCSHQEYPKCRDFQAHRSSASH
jgi:hypothetical protein